MARSLEPGALQIVVSLSASVRVWDSGGSTPGLKGFLVGVLDVIETRLPPHEDEYHDATSRTGFFLASGQGRPVNHLARPSYHTRHGPRRQTTLGPARQPHNVELATRAQAYRSR